MKTIVNKLVTGEKGQAMILALILLAVGALILAPLLGFMGTGLTAGQTYETKMDEIYAADAGVEDGLWQLMVGGLDVLEGAPAVLTPFTMNGETVNTTIEKIVGEPVYKITATAGDTTIESYVRRILLIGGPFDLGADDEFDGDVQYEGDITLGADARINGNVIAGGDIIIYTDAEIRGGVISIGGSVTLLAGADAGETEVRGSICAALDVTLGDDVRIRGSIYTPLNVIIGDNVRIEGDVHYGGTITIGSNLDISGDLINEDTGCPVGVEDEILTWSVS